jgi:hypothetical protein
MLFSNSSSMSVSTTLISPAQDHNQNIGSTLMVLLPGLPALRVPLGGELAGLVISATSFGPSAMDNILVPIALVS